ncbi:P-loop NTPase [Candidatus Nitronereus thalassa]|uniref:P-loop NTPase n=1 Tax=Candidatus Nitronereus thalassa TaxID=3020898 RepID=A0ABU3K4Y9_9BACT|nr:P-loop NTPase [Candidatus Nitronereus thalassa]MDT7041448.1 P-loop NTPase [Candidatus Nitronereus thalassa]
MAMIVSIASGKGGVGKSMVASNLGLLLARQGKRVVLVDLDIGGANLHILFGLLQPQKSLSDFVSRKVHSLDEITLEVEWGAGLRLIPGTGETLATANMPYAKKQRLIRHLQLLDADIVLLDCPPGTSYQALDFFLQGQAQIVVANPDPTSVIELYRFLKLAAIRKVLTRVLSRDHSGTKTSLMEEEFVSIEEVLAAIGDDDPATKQSAEQALREFSPLFVLNRTTPKSRVSIAYLQQVVSKFIGSELLMLGEIPADESVEQSIRIFQPVVDLAPKSSAAMALDQIMQRLLLYMAHQDRVLAQLCHTTT